MAKLKQTFSNGQTIYHQGDVSDCAFEVLSGAVEMVEYGDRGEMRVGIARTGDMFGETGLIEGGRRENMARSVGGDCYGPNETYPARPCRCAAKV